MKSQKGYTITELLLLIAIIAVIGSYLVNVIKFTQCDFEAPYQCEIVHGAGLLPLPIAPLTVWFSSDK